MNTVTSLIVLVLLTLVNAFFSMSEIAIITLNDNKIKRLAESGHKAAARIVRLTKNSSGFLATIQVGVTFAGFLSSAFAANSFTEDFAHLLSSIPFIGAVAHSIATVVITLLLSFFNLVFGELVPKKIAMQRAEQISYAVSSVLLFIGSAFKPFVWLLSKSTNAVTRLVGLDPNAEEETLTEEEILMMVDVGGEKGVIEESEREMIENIFEFGDTTASEIMTHRTEVVAVEDTDTVADVVRLAMEEGFSRIPVYREDLDDILGILYVKDLLRYVGDCSGGQVVATDIMRPAYFIPENKRLDNLFSEMTERKVQMAVVIDEYGGTAGIITMEDLIESILGNIQDEYDNEDEEISQVSDNCFTVDGTTSLDEVSDLIDIELPEGDYDTVAGFIVTSLERIPKQGEHPTVTVGRATLTVQEVEDRRISKIMIVVEPKPEPDEDASAQNGSGRGDRR
ncbi:MAG: HlyC/CorC family transporter [Clostridia bacterium]|nr:HlyC/CorC family transporter [Clostridia bacterium]